jgi:hypothetical protein
MRLDRGIPIFFYLSDLLGNQKNFVCLIVSTETLVIANKRGSCMSELFKVLTKLLGLSQLFSSMSLVLSTLVLAQNFAQSNVRESIIFSFLNSLVLLGFSLVLVFKTEWVASFVGVDSGTDSSTLISARSLLKVGIILVGLNVLLPAMLTLGPQVSSFISLSSELFVTSNTSFQKTQVLVRVLSEALPVTLSLFCIFGSEKIIQLLEKFGTQVS